MNDFQISMAEDFSKRLEHFPLAEHKPVTNYDLGKLMNILREKELFEFCNATSDQIDNVSQIDIMFGSVVRALIKGDNLDQSLLNYLEIEKKLELEIGSNLYLYAKQAALSVKALYYYKKSMFDHAKAITLECIAINEYLIRMGIKTLNTRCYEQNKNIAKTLLRGGKIEESYALYHNLFNFLFNGSSTGLYGGIFNDNQSWNTVPLIREIYTYELLVLTVEDIILSQDSISCELLPASWHKGLDFPVNTQEREIIYNWMFINKQLRQDDLCNYYEALCDFFEQQTISFYSPLKAHLLIDFYKLVKSNFYHEKKIYGVKIYNFIESKLNLKSSFLSSISSHFI